MSQPKTSIRDASKVKRATPALRPSKYDWYIKKLKQLTVGKVLVVDLPAKTTVRQLQVRLTSIENRRIEQGELVLPEGYRVSHFETQEGKVGVELIEDE